MPEMLCSTPDQEVRTLHQYFKQQHHQHRQIPPQHPSVIAAVAADIPSNENRNKVVSTPDSSQTDSDDVSPQIQRKRKTTHQRDILPRFSISIEDDHSG